MRLARFGWITVLILLWGAASACAETTLLDFYSDACGPCRAMAPAVDALARDGYAVQRINVTENRELAARFNVTAIPCFVVVDGNREVDRVVGLTTVERLKLKLRRQPAPNKREAKKGDRIRRGVTSGRPATVPPSSASIVRMMPIPVRSVPACWCAGKTHRRADRPACRSGCEEGSGPVPHQADVLRPRAEDGFGLGLRRIAIGRPTASDVRPADVEMGDAAMQHEGSRLESCGYGPDGKLACNTGLFLGYKRSTQAKNGPDDWMEISGHARSGDSGGPIFNRQGRVVGVLWGTDGEHVVGVQAGRIHQLLDAAVPAAVQQKALVSLSIIERRPTPPLPGPEPAVEPLAPMVPVPPMRSNSVRPDSAGRSSAASRSRNRRR